MNAIDPEKFSGTLDASSLITLMENDNYCSIININTDSYRNLSRSPSIISNESIFCRICHQNESFGNESDLISPCNCSGSMANVHQHCLQRWTSIASTSSCDICGFDYKCRKQFPSSFLWFKSIIVDREFTVELIITLLMAISTPLIIFATVLSSFIEMSDHYIIKPVIYALWSVTIFSWILYCVLFYFTIRYLYQSFTCWRKNNMIIELVWDQSSSKAHTIYENYI